MDIIDYNKCQINYTCRFDKAGNVIERSAMINVRTDSPEDGLRLYQALKTKLNGELGGDHEVVVKPVMQEEPEIVNENDRCPKCGGRMVLRTARNGTHQGQAFYGCENYHVNGCRYIVPE